MRLGAGGAAVLRLPGGHLLDSLVGRLLLDLQLVLELLLVLLLLLEEQVGGVAALLPDGHLGNEGTTAAGGAVEAGRRVAVHGRRLPVGHVDGRGGGVAARPGAVVSPAATSSGGAAVLDAPDPLLHRLVLVVAADGTHSVPGLRLRTCLSS